MNITDQKNLINISKFKVSSADTDMFGNLRISSLANFLIQSAINSADSLGFGFQGLRKQKLFWVLSRLTIEIYRPLKWYELVEVQTWPKDIDRLLYLRDFNIRDIKQNIIGKATSGWLAIDIETKRPKITDGIHTELFDHLKDKHAIKELPEKLDTVKSGDKFEVKTSYFDIDFNKHVTASRYIDWMMNSFEIDFHEKKYPEKLSINYLKETMPGENINFIRNKRNKNEFNFEGNNVNSNTVAFRGKIEF